MRALFLTLLLCGAALSAPVPVTRARSLPEVTPGEYSMVWGSSTYHVTLERDGRYFACADTTLFVGTWDWDPFERLLTVKERYWHPNRGVDYDATPSTFVFAFGDGLSGKTRGDTTFRVSLERFRPRR